MSGISVLILTLDEEKALPGCLEGCGWSDDVVVFDSGSRDHTRQIAESHGARVFMRPFDDYASQRMAALRDVTFRNEWILMLDADERVEPDLAAEMAREVRSAADSVAMFRMRRRDMRNGRWIRRASGYPTWFGRLVKRGRVRVERPINEEYHAEGETRDLRGHLRHFPFIKGVSWWVERHNTYSSMEARLTIERKAARLSVAELFARDPVRRRRALKALSYRLPGRPFVVLMFLLFVRGGVLDGREGIGYCLLKAWYEWLIDLKVRELSRGVGESEGGSRDAGA